jgi:hypothetical protein
MADLDQLKQKYAPVIETIQGFSDLGATLDSVSLDGDKLYLKGSVPSEVVANRVWDVIKQVDLQYADLHHEIATTGGPNQSYTVKSGDNLSKISNRFSFLEPACLPGCALPHKSSAQPAHRTALNFPPRLQQSCHLQRPVGRPNHLCRATRWHGENRRPHRRR